MYVPYCREVPAMLMLVVPVLIVLVLIGMVLVPVLMVMLMGVVVVIESGAHIGFATSVGIGEPNAAVFPHPGLIESGEHVLLSGDELPLLKHAVLPGLHGFICIIGTVCHPVLPDPRGVCCPIGTCCPMGICCPIGICCPMGTC